MIDFMVWKIINNELLVVLQMWSNVDIMEAPSKGHIYI